MRVGTARDHRHNSGYSEFCTFLDRPFHAFEFEDGEQESEVERMSPGHFLAQFELDPAFGDADDPPSADCGPSDDIEFLADSGAKDADQVVGVIASEGGVVP
jgi:hypothetical protein